MAHDERIRIGILGAGLIAGAHADGYELATDRAVVSAIADIDLASARRLAERVGGAEVVSDYRELFARDLVDAVDICLPHHLHADSIVAAARAGKHVLCEKPLCLTVGEVDTVARAVGHSAITLMCAHNQLFLPTVRRARELIHEGALGTVFGTHDRRVLPQLRSGDDRLAWCAGDERRR